MVMWSMKLKNVMHIDYNLICVFFECIDEYFGYCFCLCSSFYISYPYCVKQKKNCKEFWSVEEINCSLEFFQVNSVRILSLKIVHYTCVYLNLISDLMLIKHLECKIYQWFDLLLVYKKKFILDKSDKNRLIEKSVFHFVTVNFVLASFTFTELSIGKYKFFL